MKKLFIIFILLNLFTSNIYAQDIDEDGDYDINFTYAILPTYSVKIPTNIDVSNRHSYFEYYVKGNIYADQKVHIDMQKYCTIESIKCNAIVSVDQEKDSFSYDELTNEYTRYAVYINHGDLSSGIYHGSLSIKSYLPGEENV